MTKYTNNIGFSEIDMESKQYHFVELVKRNKLQLAFQKL